MKQAFVRENEFFVSRNRRKNTRSKVKNRVVNDYFFHINPPFIYRLTNRKIYMFSIIPSHGLCLNYFELKNKRNMCSIKIINLKCDSCYLYLYIYIYHSKKICQVVYQVPKSDIDLTRPIFFQQY